MIARADVERAVVETLDEQAGVCLVEHRQLAREVADRLGFPALVRGIAGVDLGVWIDDPPSVVLDGRYIDRLLEMPITHVAVMVDGPAAGLADARWDWRSLERLATRLPDVERIVTVWAAPQQAAVAELGRSLPILVDALGAVGVECDVEPAGHWRERDVRGYRDEDKDGSSIDEAATAIARVLVAQKVRYLETTTFPGALKSVAPLIDALVQHAKPDQLVRYLSQDYAVHNRAGAKIPWFDPLGPERFARESRVRAEGLFRRSTVLRVDGPANVADRVEIGSGVAAYDTAFPEGRDSLLPSIATARAAGTRLLRLWSSKWLARIKLHEAKRARLAELR